MSKFNKTNQKTPVAEVKNLAGGFSYQESDKMALVGILLTSFMQDKFYQSAADEKNNLVKLIKSIKDKKFIAKAAIYARDNGMRSITHVTAAELSSEISGETWAKDFYEKVITRVDDMSEILSYYLANKTNGKRKLSRAMVKGFAKAFESFDGYQLAKYQGKNKDIKLVDIVNLVHPIPSDTNGKSEVSRKEYLDLLKFSLDKLSKSKKKDKFTDKIANLKSKVVSVEKSKSEMIEINSLDALVLGLLKNTQTWESKKSEAGKIKDVKEKAAAITESWSDLIMNKKLGYLALVKNLRNILLEADDKTFNEALKSLTNPKFVASSMVFPFQIFTAIKMLELERGSKVNRVIEALNTAMELSLSNIPQFEGRTLVCIDDSGSTTSAKIASDNVKRIEQEYRAGRITASEYNAKVNALPSVCDMETIFAVALRKKVDADVMLFSSDAKYTRWTKGDAFSTIIDKVRRETRGCGTNFSSIFRTADQPYDRIVIISDEQGWQGETGGDLGRVFKDYKQKYKVNTKLYVMNLAGQGTSMFKPNEVYKMFGFTDQVFEIMANLEKDKNALVKEIEAIQL